MTKISNLRYMIDFDYSLSNPGEEALIGSRSYWKPQFIKINDYIEISFVTKKPQIVFQVGLKGSR